MNTSTCCRKDPKLVENGTIHESQKFFFFQIQNSITYSSYPPYTIHQ